MNDLDVMSALSNNISLQPQLLVALEHGLDLTPIHKFGGTIEFRNDSFNFTVRLLQKDNSLTIVFDDSQHHCNIDAHKIDTIPKLTKELAMYGVDFDILKAQQGLVKYNGRMIIALRNLIGENIRSQSNVDEVSE